MVDITKLLHIYTFRFDVAVRIYIFSERKTFLFIYKVKYKTTVYFLKWKIIDDF